MIIIITVNFQKKKRSLFKTEQFYLRPVHPAIFLEIPYILRDISQRDRGVFSI